MSFKYIGSTTELQPSNEDYLYELQRIEQQHKALVYERQRLEQRQQQQLGTASPSIYTPFSNSVDSMFSYTDEQHLASGDVTESVLLPYQLQSISLSSSNSILPPNNNSNNNNYNSNNNNSSSPIKTYTQQQPSLPIIKQVCFMM